MRVRLAVATLLSVSFFSVIAPAGAIERPFLDAEPGYRYAFPRDHGSHDRFRTEWWYYTGHLRTADGREFGFELTFFRRAMTPRVQPPRSRWAVDQLYLAHAAISDLQAGRFLYAEKVSRAALGKAGAETGGLRVWIDRWQARVDGDHGAHRLTADADGFTLALQLTPHAPPVIHGHDGISRKGQTHGQASHYYSLTRLETSGTITVADRTFEVSGVSWMDHEFGSGDLGERQVGWDWFSVQLDGGGELMIYLLRHEDGTFDPASSGTLIHADGRRQALSREEVRVSAAESWVSLRSGARYPSQWRIEIPGEALTLDLAPQLADQELVTTRSTRVTYWEGTVAAEGRWRDRPVAGRGYVELTGYAKRFDAR